MKSHNVDTRPVRMLVATLLVIGCMATATWAQQHGGHGLGADTHSGFSAEMHTAMTKMAKGMEVAPMTGDPDKDFLAMMIPHHEGAIEMARLVLLHGRDPLVRTLAEEIIAAQRAEITSMRQRLEILETGRDMTPGGFPALGGTRGPIAP
jgi:uncharacterized protein (DUF305 family)